MLVHAATANPLQAMRLPTIPAKEAVPMGFRFRLEARFHLRRRRQITALTTSTHSMQKSYQIIL